MPVYPGMQTRSALAFAALALVASACDSAPEPDSSRLAVVFTEDDGRELEIGTYDAETGALTFVDRAQDDLRDRLSAAGYSASIDLAGDPTEVDLDEGLAYIDVDLEDGDALELRVARPGARTLTIGRLVLRDADEFRLAGSWKLGNKTWPDDWLSPV